MLVKKTAAGGPLLVKINIWRAHRAIETGACEARVLMICAATVSLLAFTLLTRMHERYMFLSLAILSSLTFIRQFRYVYLGLSVLFVLNLWWPYAFFNLRSGVEGFYIQPWFDWIFGGFAYDAWQKKMWSLAEVTITTILSACAFRWNSDALQALHPCSPKIEEGSTLVVTPHHTS